MKPTRIAVLASGSGSTAEAFIRTVHQQNYPLHVVLVIANNPDAFVLERVKNLNNEHTPNERTAKLLLMPDDQKGYERFSSVEDLTADLND